MCNVCIWCGDYFEGNELVCPKCQNQPSRKKQMIKKHIDMGRKIASERKRTRNRVEKLLIKYGFTVNANIEMLLNKLILSNKYLYLAYYLEQNRLDWSNGYNYAQIGLENFKIESEQDKQIYDCIDNIISDVKWGIDGRNFRDCEWGYPRLYRIVKEQDPELYNDYKIVDEAWGNEKSFKEIP